MKTLHQPSLIEELDLEQLFKARQAALIQAYAQLPRDDNAPAPENLKEALALPSDPLHQLLRVEAYRELMLRQRINESMRGHLLAFATGDSLNELGQNYGMKRHANELDDDFRERIQGNIQGTHTAGTKAYYTSIAAAHPFVRDVNVEKGRPGEVVVSVKPLSLERLLQLQSQAYADPSVKTLLKAIEDQQDKEQLFANRTQFVDFYEQLAQTYPQRYLSREAHPLLQTDALLPYSANAAVAALMMPCVTAMMNEDDKKMLTDRIRVEEAKAIPVRIRVRLHFKPGIVLQTQVDIKNQLKQRFASTFEQAANLGWQVAPSWIYNALTHTDIEFVELLAPTEVKTLPFNAYAQLPETGLEIED